MKFTKMQGCGNDYIYVNCFTETVADPSAAAIRLSDRHFGVGGDGLVLICPSNVADFCMEMYNADGSRSEMCGNAIRCVGKYVYDRGLTDKTELTIETRAGIKTLWLNVVGGTVETVRVCMGSPEFRPEKIPVAAAGETFLEQPIDVLGATWIVSSVNTGNPHCVTYVDDAMALDFPRIGPAFENHKMFPARANIEFVEVVDDHTLRVRVWERGNGETLACGTGAVASAIAVHRMGETSNESVPVKALGGDLTVDFQAAPQGSYTQVWLTGGAQRVFSGTFYFMPQ